MNWAVALRLGRVSNLPTVWTNTLAGIVLAGGSIADARTAPLLLALSLFYVAGMYLNDAYDAAIDARERPDRPIPSGQVSADTVFALGFAMMALGLALLVWVGYGTVAGTGLGPLMGGLGLGAAIVLYDRRHKDNPLSPVLMGLCRVLVYVTAGLAVAAELPSGLLIGALLLLCYLIGLTYVAKQETFGEVRNLWPLLFLGAPVVYALTRAVGGPGVAVLSLAFVLWVGLALWFLRRARW
jgi:4-hydroxybenzoate polyprenyltransferase